jgi:1,2-diacylglycerol 3-alpha-glucosyltransferase
MATGLQGFLARRSARFIVPSRYLQRAVLAEQPEFAGRCVVVPSGVDVARFNPAVDGSDIRASWGFGDDAEVFLWLGRLGYEKRIDFLLDAFAKVQAQRPSARLVLAGSGPASDAFRRRAHALGVEGNVLFTGYVPDELVPRYYGAADAFVSASDFETQGLTLLEAMATGVPSAVASAGGYLDVLRPGENAYTFQPNDLGGAAQAMHHALDAPDAVRRAARDTAIEYSLERCEELLEETYADVLMQRAR